MNRTTAARAALALGLLASLAPGPSGSALALTADAACVGGWRAVGVPSNLQSLEAFGAATLNGQPAWLVGLSNASAEGSRVPLAAAWRDGGWVKVKAPWRQFGVLNAVEATRSDNAWTVGTTGVYNRWPVAGRWNGTAWSKVSVPRPAGQMATFVDVALLDDVRFWAVGARLDAGRLRPLAMLHRADGWTNNSPSIVNGAEGGLNDVTLAPGGRIWAAGWRTEANGQGRPWALRLDGSTWQTVDLAPVGVGRASAMDLSFRTAADGWAVGYLDAPTGYVPFLQHWDGTDWTAVRLPWADGRSIVLNTVDTDAAGRLIVGGMEIDYARRDILAVRDAGDWTVTSLSPGGLARSAMTDIARLADGVMVAGFHDTQPVTMFPCAGAVGAQTSLSGGAETPATMPLAHSGDATPGLPSGPAVAPLATVAVPGTVARDMTGAAGLADVGPNWGGVVADFNRDGWDDLFVNHHWQTAPVLLLNGASGVLSAAEGEIITRDRHGCAAADVDHVGGLDLFCTIGVNKGTSNTPQELLLDVADAGGEWQASDFGVLDGYGRGRDATFINLDRDGWPDLYVVNEASRSDAQWSSNRLYRNMAGQGFVSVPEWGVDHSWGGWCATAADLDGDGDDELLLCTSESSHGLPSGARVLDNDGSALVDRTAALGIAPMGDSDIAAADFNGDGALDIVQLSTSKLRVSLSAGGVFNVAFEMDTTAAVGIAVGDVNGDSRPDIYVARRYEGNGVSLMLVNNGYGTGFVSMTIPQPGAGKAESVFAIDWDHNGRTDFVTLNGGAGVYGPVKLLAFYPE